MNKDSKCNCHIDYEKVKDCREDDKSGCSFPNNMHENELACNCDNSDSNCGCSEDCTCTPEDNCGCLDGKPCSCGDKK